MSDNVELFLGSAVTVSSERSFLERLARDLCARGQPALIFANFYAMDRAQVDFFLVCGERAVHVELKHFTGPIVVGRTNGPWRLRAPDSSETSYPRNPYHQIREGKYALSDEMRRLAQLEPSVPNVTEGREFYSSFDSVLCIYPQVPPGSRISRLPHVNVFGYSDLLDYLTRPGGKHPWKREHWLRFAMRLGIPRQDDPGISETRAAIAYLEEYKDRFREANPVRVLVPTMVSFADGHESSSTIVDLLTRGTHAQLIGPSGYGKTHLARRLAQYALDHARLPIFVPARDYEGRLSHLLNRSIAHLHPFPASHLVRSAELGGAAVVLVVDGLNECPPALKPKFLEQLHAVYLQWNVPILITAQEEVSLPSELSGLVYRLLPPSAAETEALIRAYGKLQPTTEVPHAFDMFRTAYELSLAAECMPELDISPTRHDLFTAYVARHLRGLKHETVLHVLLPVLARHMSNNFKSVCPFHETWSVAQATIGLDGAKASVMDDLSHCGLLLAAQGQYAFRHELLQDFFETQWLVRNISNPQDLGLEIARPKNQHLAHFLVETATDPIRLRTILEATATPNILRDALRGDHGATAQAVVRQDVERALRRALEVAPRVIPEVRSLPTGYQDLWVSADVTNRSAYEGKVLSAAGAAFLEGYFVDEVFDLVEATDRAWMPYLAAEPLARYQDQFRDALFSSLYICHFLGDPPRPAASIVVQSIPSYLQQKDRRPLPEEMLQHFTRLSDMTPGQLVVCCKLMHHHTRALSHFVPMLLRAGMASDYSNLKLEVLEVAADCQGFVQGHPRDEIVRILLDISGQDILVNSGLIEALAAYDLVKSPLSEDEALADVRAVLSHPEDEECQRRATDLVSNIFEDFYQNAFYNAIENLKEQDRTTLLIMASLGADPPCLVLDWVLKRLVTTEDPRTVKAFIRWLEVPPAKSAFTQRDVQAFVLAHIGCARYVSALPETGAGSTDDHRAWQTLGKMIFLVSRPHVEEHVAREQCSPLWEFLHEQVPHAAIDVFMHLRKDLDITYKDCYAPIGRLLDLFKNRVGNLMCWGLENRETLTSLFESHNPFSPNERIEYMIHQLKDIRDIRSERILQQFVDDPDLGSTAVEVLRSVSLRSKSGKTN